MTEMTTPKWLDKAEYPFKSNYFRINDQRLHFLDEGDGDTFLFVHGTPSWSFDFRKVIKNLRTTTRCVAIDHVGFGLSDKPQNYDYSPQNHSRTLEQFVLAKNLTDITLVLHDFGGPIGFSFALRHPDRVKRIVVLNSWLWSAEKEPEYRKLKKVLKNPLLPLLYRWLNFSPRVILPAAFGAEKLPKRLRRQYTLPFANRHQREGTVAFAHSLLNDQKWFESLWQQREPLANKPILLIWGMKDPVILPKYLRKFQEGFPRAHTVELATAGHFPQEENADEVSLPIRQFCEID